MKFEKGEMKRESMEICNNLAISLMISLGATNHHIITILRWPVIPRTSRASDLSRLTAIGRFTRRAAAGRGAVRPVPLEATAAAASGSRPLTPGEGGGVCARGDRCWRGVCAAVCRCEAATRLPWASLADRPEGRK